MRLLRPHGGPKSDQPVHGLDADQTSLKAKLSVQPHAGHRRRGSRGLLGASPFLWSVGGAHVSGCWISQWARVASCRMHGNSSCCEHSSRGTRVATALPSSCCSSAAALAVLSCGAADTPSSTRLATRTRGGSPSELLRARHALTSMASASTAGAIAVHAHKFAADCGAKRGTERFGRALCAGHARVLNRDAYTHANAHTLFGG